MPAAAKNFMVSRIGCPLRRPFQERCDKDREGCWRTVSDHHEQGDRGRRVPGAARWRLRSPCAPEPLLQPGREGRDEPLGRRTRTEAHWSGNGNGTPRHPREPLLIETADPRAARRSAAPTPRVADCSRRRPSAGGNLRRAFSSGNEISVRRPRRTLGDPPRCGEMRAEPLLQCRHRQPSRSACFRRRDDPRR